MNYHDGYVPPTWARDDVTTGAVGTGIAVRLYDTADDAAARAQDALDIARGRNRQIASQAKEAAGSLPGWAVPVGVAAAALALVALVMGKGSPMKTNPRRKRRSVRRKNPHRRKNRKCYGCSP
jgi:hypothetical protein